jgi:hypothetical protein
MIKLVFCVRRKPELSVSEFRKRWRDYQTHTRSIAKALNAVRLTHSLTLAIEENEAFMLTRGTAEPFDGVIEVWWKDAAQAMAGLQDKRIQEMVLSMRAAQKDLADLRNSMIFFASEDDVEEFDH